MKTLTLVRHAKAETASDSASDFERGLILKGKKAAAEQAINLHELGISPDLWLSSPATRAAETAEIFAEAYHLAPTQIQTPRTLYHASKNDILDIIRKLGEKSSHIILFGHNPGISEFFSSIINKKSLEMKTSEAAVISLPISSWADLSWGKGKLNYFLPKPHLD